MKLIKFYRQTILASFLVFGIYMFSFAQNENSDDLQLHGQHIICIDSLSYFLEDPEIEMSNRIIDSIKPDYNSLAGLTEITNNNGMFDYLVFRSLGDSIVNKMYYISDSLLLAKARSEFLQSWPIEKDSANIFVDQEFNALFIEYLNLMGSTISLFENILSEEEKLASMAIRNANGFTIVFAFPDYDKYKSESLKGDYFGDLLITRMIWGCLLSGTEELDCADKYKIGLELFDDYFIFVYPLYEENQFLGEIRFPVFREL